MGFRWWAETGENRSARILVLGARYERARGVIVKKVPKQVTTIPAVVPTVTVGAARWLAASLDLVELGQPWPEGARNAYIAKAASTWDQPLPFRILMILTLLYRTWTKYKLQDLTPRTQS